MGGLLAATLSGWCASADEYQALLDSFTGQWKGEIRVHALDGYLLKTFEAVRTYSWEGDQQVVKTRFSDGSQEILIRDLRSVELGRLRSRVDRPGTAEEEYSGAFENGGIVWTNVQRNNRDLEERIIEEGNAPAIETSSVEVMRVTGVSGLVRVTMHFEPTDGRVLAGSATAAEVVRLQKQVGELERRLAGVDTANAALSEIRSERDTLYEQLSIAKSRAEELENQVSDLEDEQKAMDARLADSRAKGLEVVALAATVAKLESGNAVAKREAEQLNESLSSAREDAEAANRSLEIARADADRFGQRVEELTVVISEARNANNAANLQIGGLDRTLLETRNEIRTLRTEARGVIDERDALADELAEAQKESALASQRESSGRELQRKLETVRVDRDQQASRATELSNQLEALRADVEKLRAGSDAGSLQVGLLQRELAAAETAAESHAGEISRLRSQLADAEKERGDLATQAVAVQELTTARDRAVTESSDLTRKREVLEAEIVAVRSETESETARAKQLEAQLAAVASGLETQTNEVARLNERLAEAMAGRSDADALAAETETLRTQVVDLEQELAASVKSASDTHAAREALALKLALLESRPDITADALEFERSENRRRYERAEGGRLESLGQLTGAQEDLRLLREEMALRDRQLAEFKQMLASVEGTGGALDKVRAKVRELESVREQEMVKFAAERDRSRAEIIALEQSVDELRSSQNGAESLRSLAEQRQQDNENLVRRIDEMTVERGQLMARLASLEAELANASGSQGSKVDRARTVVAGTDDLAERVERLDRRVIELESERNSLRYREEILEAQLAEASELRDGTLARFQDVVSQLNAVRKERDRLARANVSLEADLRAAQAQRTLVGSDGSKAPDDNEGGFLSRIVSMGSDGGDSPREIDRAIASYEIIGVSASEEGDKAILNGRVYHGGDVVDVDLGITFHRVDGDALVFSDENGREYRRRF